MTGSVNRLGEAPALTSELSADRDFEHVLQADAASTLPDLLLDGSLFPGHMSWLFELFSARPVSSAARAQDDRDDEGEEDYEDDDDDEDWDDEEDEDWDDDEDEDYDDDDEDEDWDDDEDDEDWDDEDDEEDEDE